jgi:hypothetical protein
MCSVFLLRIRPPLSARVCVRTYLPMQKKHTRIVETVFVI